MGREGLGEFEHLVLLAVARLGAEAYGVPIVDELERQTGRRVSRASVYVALKRLEAKGLIHSTLGDPTPERGGRAKRYFQISPAAEQRLIEARDALMKMWANLPGMFTRERPS
jgi:PadR family transcriptional regulator PadR